MLKIKLDTSPLGNGHGGRGIGMYTRMLGAALAERDDVALITGRDETVPDLVHYPFFDLFFATLPLKKTAPTVVTIHDVIPLMFPDYYRPGIKGRARFLKQIAALRTVKMVITDSLFSKQQIVKYLHLKADKVVVVPLAADPAMKRPAPSAITDRLAPLALPKKYVLYVGDINYNKNIPQLIKMVKFLPDSIDLVCVGHNFKPHPIPEWQWIETQMALSDVAHRVHFVTEIAAGDQELLAAIYANAVVYVQPSLAEGFGLPVLEAMQCQTPVIAANNSSLLEVGGKHAVFAEPVAEALAQKVSEIHNWSEPTRQTWVKEAYEWSQTFSWSLVADKTVAVYQQAVHEK